MQSETCSIQGCSEQSRALGMCNKHYKRVKIHGTPDGVRDMSGSLEERFWRFVSRGAKDECWAWGGVKSQGGYGRIKFNGRLMPSSHVSFEIHQGKVPNHLHVLHRCDNPPCVNPDHLFLGTQKDNLADRAAKGRFNPVRGEKHGSAVLTEDQVRAIRLDGRKHGLIAADYGITRPNVSYIKSRKSWAHVPD